MQLLYLSCKPIVISLYVDAIPQIALAPARKPYWIGLLFTYKNGDFGAISVTEQSCAVRISTESGESHIRKEFILYQTAFAPARKPYRIELLFTDKNGDFGAISVTEQSCAAPNLIPRFSLAPKGRVGENPGKEVAPRRSPKSESHISDRCSYYSGQLSSIV